MGGYFATDSWRTSPEASTTTARAPDVPKSKPRKSASSEEAEGEEEAAAAAAAAEEVMVRVGTRGRRDVVGCVARGASREPGAGRRRDHARSRGAMGFRAKGRAEARARHDARSERIEGDNGPAREETECMSGG